MIYKNVSIKRVIAKVLTDLDAQEGDHRISDLIEWGSEAFEKIGIFPSFINKVTGKDDIPLLTVTNYQTKLPADFHGLIQVAFSKNVTGPFYPMRYATGSFDHGAEDNETSSTDVTQPESSLITLAMSLFDLTYTEALSKINNEPNTRSLLNSMLTDAQDSATSSDELVDTTNDYTYLIKPNYIKTNVETGFIMLAYQAIPTDIDGYPLIPDDQSFMEAIYWYITMKTLYPKWQRGSIRDAVYYDSRRSWNYYCKQAQGNALMPNRDQMESIKNTWLRLVPEINEHSSGFSTLGQQQIIYNN